MEDLSRRQALTTLAAATTAACACCALGADEKPEKPDDKPAPRPTSVSIGKLSDYPDQKFYDAFAKPAKVMVCRLDDRLVVMSAICTHKSCTLKIAEDKKLRCPCHKSFFGEHGTVLEGQAKSSLVRYALKQADDGTITADLTQSFAEKQWDDPKAMIAIKK